MLGGFWYNYVKGLTYSFWHLLHILTSPRTWHGPQVDLSAEMTLYIERLFYNLEMQIDSTNYGVLLELHWHEFNWYPAKFDNITIM